MLFRSLWSDDTGDYLWRLASPFGLLAVLGPVVALLGLPQTFLNLVTNVPWTKTVDFHYAAIPLTAITLASVEGGCWLVRRLGDINERIEVCPLTGKFRISGPA